MRISKKTCELTGRQRLVLVVRLRERPLALGDGGQAGGGEALQGEADAPARLQQRRAQRARVVSGRGWAHQPRHSAQRLGVRSGRIEARQRAMRPALRLARLQRLGQRRADVVVAGAQLVVQVDDVEGEGRGAQGERALQRAVQRAGRQRWRPRLLVRPGRAVRRIRPDREVLALLALGAHLALGAQGLVGAQPLRLGQTRFGVPLVVAEAQQALAV